MNNLARAITCPNDYTCADAAGAAGRASSTGATRSSTSSSSTASSTATRRNNCNVSGLADDRHYTSTNYLGGDWAGVTQKINAGYFTDLGVNTLWITVPVKNADDVIGAGVSATSGNCATNGTSTPRTTATGRATRRTTEPCFGTAADLEALVHGGARARTSRCSSTTRWCTCTRRAPSTAAPERQPGWFTPFCQCGGACGCSNYDTTCWFAPYLAHYDYTNSAPRAPSRSTRPSRSSQTYGNDAFRLDAIKQVDPSWLTAPAPGHHLADPRRREMPQQRFYMVGETYDFQNRALIASLIDPPTMLDGQFDFPLRIRLVEAHADAQHAEHAHARRPRTGAATRRPGCRASQQFMDSNDDVLLRPTPVMSTFIGNHDLPALHPLRRADAPGVAQADSPSNPSAADGKSNAWIGRARARDRPEHLRAPGQRVRPCSSPTRARRSSTTATRSACPARAIPTTGA